MSLFQSNLRKQIRKLPKILKSVKIIHYYSMLFIRVRGLKAIKSDVEAKRVGSRETLQCTRLDLKLPGS